MMLVVDDVGRQGKRTQGCALLSPSAKLLRYITPADGCSPICDVSGHLAPSAVYEATGCGSVIPQTDPT